MASITGTAGNDTLTGTTMNDVINGGTGADTMTGGTGSDIYIVDNTGDIVSEAVNAGTDTVQSSVTYTLGSNIEKLILTGADHINGTGNQLNNTITGNSGDNVLDGGLGTDAMVGGLGNDTYIVDNTGDIVNEAAGAGTDTVQASVTYALTANVEKLILTGSGNINGTGNTSNNMITGNSGNNILSGGAGADTMAGGLGNDTYVVDNTGDIVTENADEGIDTANSSITYTLGANVENLTLTGSVAINGTGNALNNMLTGNSYSNMLTGGAGLDTLSGGAGADKMLGGSDDDTYIVDNIGDVVTENAGEGTDIVKSSISYTLGSNVENLTLTGASTLTATGNTLNNALTGNSGNNTLNGGAGADTMTGGLGNDTYLVDDAGDVVVENASEGTDMIQASVSYTLGANVENLTLTGTTAINGTGNALDNVLTGNSMDNTLSGGAGNDTYIVGNTGDVVVENADEGTDTVQSSVTYTLGTNVENLTLTGIAAINGTGNASDNVLTGNSANNTLTGGAGNDTYVVANTGDVVVENVGEGTDTVQSSITYTLGANVENLTLTGTAAINGTGNALDNIITGNGGINKLIGGAGNDTYVVGTGDVVVENAGEGTDTVKSSVTYTIGANVENLTIIGTAAINGTGNTLDNVLTGNSSNNVLNGGAGTDTMTGGLGNDTYVVDNAGDVVIENAGEGTDTVQSSLTYTLGANLENLTLTGTAIINGTGNELNNVLTGNSGNNVLDGGAGADAMAGGLGNDTYVVDNTGDKVTESASAGTDKVLSSVTFILGNNIEHLTLTGTGNINGTGNVLNNILTGNSGNNVLNGSTGVDTMTGGLGDDTYVVDNAGDVVTDGAGEGTDTVQSSITYTLAANVENLTLTGNTAINGTGNEFDNMITGNVGSNKLTGGAGNDTLSGGVGTDTLVGGVGDDVYIVDNAGDVVTENTGEGTDTVQTAVSYTLGANLENLMLTGTAVINGTGNTLNNLLIGNNGNNILNGGIGADTMAGGLGNDTYVVDHTGDQVTEAAGAGTDTVQSSVSYVLGDNVEHLTLTGTSSINGTGNTLNNVINGNSGDNILDGGTGSDSMAGGIGNDTYNVDTAGDVVTEAVGAGTDTVESSINYILGANLENLKLTGTSSINGTGNALNNVINGNSGDNVLNGGTGADSMAGGVGHDTYIVDNAGDVITENADEGTDTVQSSVSYALGDDVENITLTGTSAIDGMGNALNNVIIGNSGNNLLTGEAGDDFLNGGAGADIMAGGLGNDTFIVDNTGDVVTESVEEGSDTVQSSVTYALGDNIENLLLTGSVNINGTGNELNNAVSGNGGNNVLDGGLGIDTLAGGAGNDTYVLDNIDDVVVENAGEGTDIIQANFTYVLGANFENLILTGNSNINGTGNDVNNVLTGNNGNNVLDGGLGADTMTGGLGDDIYFVDNVADVVAETANGGTDTVQASVTYALGTSAENLTLTGTANLNGTANNLNNILHGNSGNNVLNGGTGADSMAGALGDDTYVVDNTGDVVTENADEGTDTVQSSITFTLGDNFENLTLTGSVNINGTGNEGNNLLAGNSGNNVLDGGLGADTMSGGTGSDTYILDNLDDFVVETAGEGTDTVQSSVTYILGANIENLTLTGSADINGTGNELGNMIIGNSGSNVLTGMAGNDTYVVDNVGDIVIESAGEGTDAVQSSISYTLGANLENLALTGSSNIDGTGNAVMNVLVGNSGDNILDGGVGADSMAGGLGNDTYYVDNTGDVVTEAANAGTDTVVASVAYTLGANVEKLILTGTADVNGTGNALSNHITGNSGNNVLNGGTGADTLVGGSGDDTYIVDHIGDAVTENAAEGTDEVQSSVTFVLGANLEKLILTGTSAVNGAGNELDNVITGNSGNNVLDGGAGADTLTGGLGNDTYIIDNIDDAIIENANEGTDTIQSSITYILGTNFENLTLTGTAAIDGIGTEANNVITGNSGSNILDGGAGADTMAGGLGNDTYYVDNTGDVVTEAEIAGADTVAASVTYTLGANVEDLILTGTANLNGTGNTSNNHIAGNSGSNVLNGDAGVDTLIGGLGDDTYMVDNIGDVVTENAGEGTDEVQSSVTYTLSAQVEKLILTGAASIDGTGNELDNLITGNGGNNVLNGGTGADTMTGGLGNDTYIIDSAGDVITEYADEGIDTVQSSSTYTLAAHFENLTLTGTDNIDGAGNALDNRIIGSAGNNMLTGGEGSDTLDGGAGVDTMTGGTGNDEYWVDDLGDVIMENAGEGTDSVCAYIDYTLAANFENLTLVGSGNINGTGNDLDNLIVGNSGINVMAGGAGNDTYWVDNIGDVVEENTDEGIDLVRASTSYVIGANVENLILTGSSSINGTGNEMSNRIEGNSGSNILNGGMGADTLIGGLGDDTYVVDELGDVITELAGEGVDTIQSFISYVLNAGDHVENLTLAGTADINGTGNDSANLLTGNSGNNDLIGGAGNDTLNGGAGIDTLVGGIGDDNYVVDNIGDVVTESAGAGTDTVQSSISYILGDDLEILTLIGTDDINGTGNGSTNYIQGNSGNNILDGGAGADGMAGGAGDDTYIIDNTGDKVAEFADGGTDTVKSGITHALGSNIENLILTGSDDINGTGNSSKNEIYGNAGNNILNGEYGDDTMAGGAGNDTYIYGLGYGNDSINNYSTGTNDTDTLQLQELLLDSITYSLDNNDLVCTITQSGETVRITDWALGTNYQVDTFVFSDGTLTAADINSMV